MLTFRLAAGLVTGLVLLAVALMCWRLWVNQQQERAQIIDETERRASQLVVAVADRIGVMVRSSDFVLQQVRREFGVDDARFHVLAGSLLRSFPERSVLQLSIADADGDLRYASVALFEPVNIRDRDHFKAHLGGGDKLVISKPVVGRVSKAWAVTFSRPVVRDGRFAGLAVLLLSPQYISQVLSTLELTAKDSIALFDAEGTFLARNHGVEQVIGQTLSPPRPWMLPDAAARGIYRDAGLGDGQSGTFAWARLPVGDLVAVVGLDEGTVLAPLEARFKQDWIDAAVVAALLVALGAGLLALLARLARGQRLLGQSEARFRGLTQLSADWYWEQDSDYRFVTIEGVDFALSGIPANAHLGKARWDLPALNLGEGDWARHRAELDARRPFREFEIRRPDVAGRMQWASVSGEPLFDEHGKFCGYRGVSRNITERKLAEQALRQSQEQLRALLDGIPDRIWLKDVQGRYLAINRSEEQAHGLPAAQVIGKLVNEFRPAHEARAVNEEDAAAMAAAGQLRYERMSNLDGSWCEIIKAPILTAQGDVVGLVGISRDISARKLAEQALRERTEEAQALFEASTAGIMLLRERVIVRCNRRLEECYGYAPGELIGKPTRILYDSDDEWRRVGSDLYGAMRSGTVAQLVVAGVHKSGRRIWNLLAGRYLDPAQPELGAVFTTSDITAQQQAEDEREKLQAQLRQAHKMEALGTLAGGIAHDFNNLLAAILGNVALARQDASADSPLQHQLSEIDKASLRARDLVRQILTYSRQQAPERRIVSVLDIAQEAVRLLRATLPSGIELVVDLAPDTPKVLGDRTQLQQVLMNLGSNAWQAMAGKPGRIEITLADSAWQSAATPGGLAPARCACLRVADNGPGMDAATRERIFDPFFTTKPVGEGTGLGLAVVQGIVKSHGGTITVNGEPGRGTAFCIYLPAVDGDVSAPEAMPPTPAPGTGQRILLLDDEEALVLIGEAALKRLGYRVVVATLPAQALAEFKADPTGFDLLITDLNMPGLSGLEVASEMRRLRPDLPVLLASGFVSDDTRQQALAMGIGEVAYKPLSPDDLALAVARLLQVST